MLSSNERITARQFQILFLIEAFGTGFIVMPRISAEYAGQDGWLVAMLLIVPGLIFVAMVSGVAKSFGNEKFTDYTRRLLSAPVAAVICLLLWFKILFCAGLELRLFGEIVRALLLENTPMPAVYIAVLAVAAYAAAKGIETRARLAEILIVVIAVPLVILGLVALFNIDLTNLMPALITPPEQLARGVLSLGFIFTGIEFIWLALPYLNKPQEGQKAAVSVMVFAGLLMAIITAFTIAKFGPLNTAALRWPALNMMDMLNVPGSLVSRQGALILSFWMLSVFAFMAASLFYGAVLGRDQTGKGKHLYWVLASALIICTVAMIPFSQEQIYRILNKIFLSFGLGFWLVLPIILKFRKGASALLLLFVLAGCWDSEALENRDFALAFGIDAAEEARYEFYVAIAGLDSDEEDESKSISSAQGQTLMEAIRAMDAGSGRDLFLGQAKTAVFSKSLIEDRALFREAIGTIENQYNIDRAITVIATDDMDILSEDKVVEFYRLAPKSGGHSFYKTFEAMMADLRDTGNTLLPLINQGAIAIKDYQLAGELDATELRGLLWHEDKACEGAVLTSEDNISMLVKRNRGALRFIENDGRLMCVMDIQVEGELCIFRDETPPDKERLSWEYERLIKDEIENSVQKLQHELGLDAINLQAVLRKRQHSLYRNYADNWERSFRDMQIIALVNCKIRT